MDLNASLDKSNEQNQHVHVRIFLQTDDSIQEIQLFTNLRLSIQLTINVFKSALSAGFFFKHRSTRSLNSEENTPIGIVGGGSLTI